MIEVAPSGTPEPAPPADGPTEAVAEMVRGLTKALRVHLLYEGSSPSLERFLDMLRTRMALLWEQLPHLTLAVEEDALLWNGATVYTAEERNDNFAFLFYKDGVREIGFLPGFERDELDVLVGILARVQRIREDEEDLLTLLWEHDLSRFRYQHVEVLTEGVEIPSVSARSRSPIPPPLTPTSLTPANFEGTLHFLEDAELRRLADELRLELDRDLWGDVLSALFDRLEDGREERQLRVVGTLHDLFPTLLGSGNLAAATRVLRELATLAAGDSPLPPAVLRAIREMFARLAAPETVREIVRAIEESPASFTEDQVALLLRFFPAEALPALIRAAETTSVGAVRDPMIRAAERLAATEPERLIPLVEDADDVLATGAARLVGKIGIPAAAPAVVGLLRRSHAPVRLVAIGVLQTLRTPASGAALQEALDDSDREVRIAATRALASLRFNSRARPSAGRGLLPSGAGAGPDRADRPVRSLWQCGRRIGDRAARPHVEWEESAGTARSARDASLRRAGAGAVRRALRADAPRFRRGRNRARGTERGNARPARRRCVNGGSRMHDAPSGAERGVRRLGREWLFAFYTALRSVRLYPLENQAVQNALRELEAASSGLFRVEGAIEMRHVGDFFFINDLRLRPDLASYATFGVVGRALGRHGVGSLEVDPGAEMWEWTTLLSLLVADPSAGEPFAALEAGLDRAGVRHLHPGGETDDVPEPPDVNLAREAAKRTYAETVSVAREVMTGARIGKGVNLRRVKRAVQSIVDQVLTNETSITGMTVLRDYDEYTFTHSVNVCIFSIALGKRLALSKPQLYELGLGALMHDIGKVTLPLEVMNKAGPLDEAEWELMREHPAEGLLSLFGMRGFAELPLRAMLMAYEHHMKLDLSGYPRCNRPRSPTLFSRIVSIADSFDAATTKRSYQAQPFPPDQVLRDMSQNPARGLDPLLVRAFISTTGFYPVGTLVILDSYELAVVVAQDPRPEALHQPVVRIIYDEMGNPIEPPRTVELSETDPVTGAPRRAIIKTTDPERYGINVGDLFL